MKLLRWTTVRSPARTPQVSTFAGPSSRTSGSGPLDERLHDRTSHLGVLLDVSGGSTADGTDVIQVAADGGTDQQWQLVKAG